MNPTTKAHLGLLATNLFFAINLSAVKYLTGNHFVQPFGLNVIRVGVSVMLFWMMFCFANKKEHIPIARADYGRMVLCGLTGIAINQMLFLKGLSLTFSIHAVLLMLTTPILITVIAAWLLKEKITLQKTTGLFLGISGASLLIVSGKNSGTGSQVIWGDVLIVINAISYTFYFILVKPLMLKYPPVQVIRAVFTIGLLMVFPFGWNEFRAIDWGTWDSVAWTCLALVVVGGTFLAYLFNIYGIKVLGASVAGTYIYLQPLFAAVIAMVFLHEKLEAYKIIAALLIFTGVYLCNASFQKKENSAH